MGNGNEKKEFHRVFDADDETVITIWICEKIAAAHTFSHSTNNSHSFLYSLPTTTMDAQVESFYNNIFTDLKVDQEEAQELVDYFDGLNPPPDKLVWLRATAFRLGCGFLSEDRDKNVALLRAINAIVHSLEKTCML